MFLPFPLLLRRILIGLLLLVWLGSSGCAWWLRSDYPERRRAAIECEQTKGAGDPECVELRREAEAEYEHYEGEAETAWGCGGAVPGEGCPLER